MDSEKLTDQEIQRFLNACEDLMKLGTMFTGNVRSSFSEFRRISDPVLKSNYVDKSAAELLTHSLTEFEKKMDSNLDALNRICMKGSKWFAFFLGKSLGISSQSLEPQASHAVLGRTESHRPSERGNSNPPHVRKMGA